MAVEERKLNIAPQDLTKISDEDLRALADSLQGLLLKGQIGEEEFDILREAALNEMKLRGIRPETVSFEVRPKDVFNRLMKSLIFLKAGVVKIEGKGEDKQYPFNVYFDKTGFNEAFKRAAFSMHQLLSPKTDGLVFSSKEAENTEDVYDLWLVPKGRQITFKKEDIRGDAEDFSYFYQIRRGSGQVCSAARSSARKDTVKPGRFVRTNPLTRGVQPEISQTTEDIAGLFEGKNVFPVHVVTRRTNLDVQIHKNGGKTRVWLNDGHEITKRIPYFVECFDKSPVKDCVFLANMEVHSQDGHYSSPEAMDRIYTKSKDEPVIMFEAYDCLFYGQDIHGLTWKDREDVIDKVVGTHARDVSQFSRCLVEPANSAKHLVPLLNRLKKSKMCESALIYTNEPYSLSGSMMDRIVVFEKTFKFNAVVLDVRETHIPGISNFFLGVDPGNLNFSGTDYVSINGKKMIKIGESLSTTRWSYPGDIVEVSARGLLHTFDEETNLNAVNAFEPRVVNKVNSVGFPNGLPSVIKRAEEDTLYYHRILDPDGKSS